MDGHSRQALCDRKERVETFRLPLCTDVEQRWFVGHYWWVIDDGFDAQLQPFTPRVVEEPVFPVNVDNVLARTSHDIWVAESTALLSRKESAWDGRVLTNSTFVVWCGEVSEEVTLRADEAVVVERVNVTKVSVGEYTSDRRRNADEVVGVDDVWFGSVKDLTNCTPAVWVDSVDPVPETFAHWVISRSIAAM
jgi:hypothetical protein